VEGLTSAPTAQDSKTPPRDAKATPRDKAPANGGNPVSRLLDRVASVQVPHNWFTHFYLVSVASSVFWAAQILLQGRVLDMVLAWQQDASIEKTDGPSRRGMTLDQITVVWALMAMQGVRRLYESTVLIKPSHSKMFFLHWVLGVGFYAAMGIVIWVEGIRE
jgi:3-oxo-5-alpha-steroid 4-dehydrogenase 3 / polyprenol reductase